MNLNITVLDSVLSGGLKRNFNLCFAILSWRAIYSVDDFSVSFDFDVSASISTSPFLSSRVISWLSGEGGAADGTRYGSPDSAIPWGTRGCPLIPRSIRHQLSGVRLPRAAERHFKEGVTFDQLDSTILSRLNMNEIPEVARRDLREVLYNQQLHHVDKVAIPAGMPLLWLERLPILSRTRNAVRRAFQQMEAAEFVIVPISEARFLELQSVGIMALVDLACVVESAECETDASNTLSEPKRTSIPVLQTAESMTNWQGTQDIVGNMTALLRELNLFVGWASAETNSRTIGEAVAEASNRSIGVNKLEPILSTPLSGISDRPIHPYSSIEMWAMQLSPRGRAILLGRMASTPTRYTLQEISEAFGITRERIRQLEVRLRNKLEKFLKSEDALPVRWRAETIRQRVGVASPNNVVEDLLEPPSGCIDYRAIVLNLAGPYSESNGWTMLTAAKNGDPTSKIFDQTDEVGRIDQDLASNLLSAWGMDERYHQTWLTRESTIKLFNGQLVRWGSSIPDRMAFALADIGHPTDVDDLIAHVAERGTRGSVVNALSFDPRFTKVDPSNWALASWGLPEYSGVPYEIRNLLEANGGLMQINKVIAHMSSVFGVREATSKAYCYAPMFVAEGDTLRLRTPDDGPSTRDVDAIKNTKGVFHLGAGRVSLLVRIDTNILRGSGTQLTHAAGSILNVQVNDKLAFADPYGSHVRVTFPESVLTGPTMGSIRIITENIEAEMGDLVSLVFDRSDMTVSAQLVNQLNLLPSWDSISILTGIPTPVDLSSLGAALHCEPGDVRSVLKYRGDTVLLEVLPPTAPSASLNEALDAFEGEFGNSS